MRLSIIIVSYNVKYFLDQCLESVFRSDLHLPNGEELELEVFVVDNASVDGSAEMVREKYSQVHLIANKDNTGFATANNQALRLYTGDWALLLNPDTVVAEPAIARCIAFMDEHPDAGALGVKMHTENGRPAMESRRGIPSPLVAFYKMTGLCSRFPNSRRYGKYYMSYLPWDEAAEIEVVSGAFCFLRREALNQVGVLDEDFFMYGEDIDLSYRLLKGGWHNWYLPEHILHYKGESTQKSSFRYVHVFYEAMLIFFRKHYGHLSFLITIPVKLAIFGKAFLALVSMLGEKISRSLGFFSSKREKLPVWLFVGSRQMITACRKIARRNALTAEFCEADAKRHPQGHLAFNGKIKEGVVNYVVYDTGTFSYEQILNIFEENADSEVLIGFYHPENATIITGREVIR